MEMSSILDFSTNFPCFRGAVSYYTWFNILLVNHGKVSFTKYFMTRYLKTLPVIFAGILLVVAFPPLLGGGPLSQQNLVKVTNNCIKNYWSELLGFSNQISPSEMVRYFFINSSSNPFPD